MEQQQKRFNKLNYESFFLLKVEKNDLGFLLNVSGSTRNVYSIQINQNSRRLECNCPDAKSWALYHNCLCKHVCFILLRMFKEIYNKESKIFKDRVLTLEEYNYISNKLIEMNINEQEDIVDLELIEKFKNLKTDNNPFKSETSLEDKMCPICFLDIDGASVKCPECRNVLHIECMEKWLEMGNKTCVYCRSNVWEDYNLEGDYLCLN